MNVDPSRMSSRSLLHTRFDSLVANAQRTGTMCADLLRDICHDIIINSPSVPTSDFAEIVCALRITSTPQPLRRATFGLLNSLRGQPGECYTLLLVCAHLLSIDDRWKQHLVSSECVIATSVPPALPKRVLELECVVQEIHGKGRKPQGQRWVELSVANAQFGEFILDVRDPWVATALQVRTGSTVKVLHATRSGSRTLMVEGVQSACILEPDYLVDASDIGHCMLTGGHDARLHLLRLCLPRTSSLPMIQGIAVGKLFEHLIANPSTDLNTLIPQISKSVSHMLHVITTDPSHEESRLQQTLVRHASIIAQQLDRVSGAHTYTEQSMLSVRFGISGRLDALAFDHETCIVTELKSGKPPAGRILAAHVAQVICYALLAKQTRVAKSGNLRLQLLYSAARGNNALHEVAFDATMANYVMQVRNDIVALEMRLCNRVFADVVQTAQLAQQDVPPYIAVQAQEFEEFTNVLVSTETPKACVLYVKLLMSFIARENWCQRLSPGRADEQQGFSALWRRSLQEKQQHNQAIGWLRVREQNRTILDLSESSSRTSVFRTGDIVVMYPHDEVGNCDIGATPIHRCRIVSLDTHTVCIDKPIPYTTTTFFALERDFIASSFKALFTSVYLFATAPALRQRLFLGMQKPETRERPRFKAEYLSQEQEDIVHEMACAKHYYLLQGPPGTGKTSRVVRAFCERQYTMTDECTLICAYTNRSVEEICYALRSSNLPFVRIEPSYASSEESVFALDIPAGSTMAEELRKKRLIVGTISSLLTQEEVWRGVQPHTMLVDEASQVTEAHLCGLVARVQKFVLIGDQHQLPPVVAQQPAGTRVPLPELQELSCTSLHNSPFHRLHQQASTSDWSHAFGMLLTQGRMHRDICALPSSLFYENALATFDTKNLDDSDSLTSSQQATHSLLSKRVVFVDVPITEEHRLEAHIVASIVQILKEHTENVQKHGIGVVAPFRKHLSGIRRALLEREIEHADTTIDTIERFQGSERDSIVFSLGATVGNLNKLSSIDERTEVDRRLNVAITRARQHLIVVGNAQLASTLPAYQRMLSWIKEHGLFVAAAHVPDLNKEFSGNSPFL